MIKVARMDVNESAKGGVWAVMRSLLVVVVRCSDRRCDGGVAMKVAARV